jgi:hypothetical protein
VSAGSSTSRWRTSRAPTFGSSCGTTSIWSRSARSSSSETSQHRSTRHTPQDSSIATTPLLATAEPFGRLQDRTVIGSSRGQIGEAHGTRSHSRVQLTRSCARPAPPDVAEFHGGAVDWRRDGIYVPFGGGSNDWAALELAAWLASAADVPIKLVGTTADPSRTRRDASRLLADASIALQRVVGVVAEPVLAEQSAQALLAVVEPASLVAAGLPDRFRAEGLDATRTALVRSASPPVLLVQRGARPGGLAPGESRTRFSWSLEG